MNAVIKMFVRPIPLALVAATCLAAARFPDPARDIRVAAPGTRQVAVLAGGCFWGVEAVFERLRGVADVVSGFAGGSKMTAEYEVVSSGVTSHAESVKITYDPAIITYGQLLKVFFAVAHDPTQLNGQGPDEGAQYRSAIFYVDSEQKNVADAYIAQLTAAHVFTDPIVTAVAPLDGFYPAAEYHQNFLVRHPDAPYIVVNDVPKLRQLETRFPELLKHKMSVRRAR